MSIQTFETEAVMTVCGVESCLPLTVKYIILKAFPETREQPAEPRQVEILSVYHGEYPLNEGTLSQAQLEAIGDAILGAWVADMCWHK